MKRSICFLLFCLSAQNALALNPFENHRHKLGGILDYWNYEEPGLMQDSGILYGAEYGFRNTVYSSVAYELNAEILLGRTNYEGRDLNSGSPLEFEQTNTAGMLQFFMGPLVPVGSDIFVIPKLGLLYRKLIDHNDEFAGDYQRDQEYTVVPIGIDIILQSFLDGQWILSTWFSAYFRGKNKTYLTDVGGDRDLSLEQDEGSGMEVSLTFRKNDWYVTGMLRQWALEDSEAKIATVPSLSPPTNSFLEPKNETLSIGARVGCTF